MPAFFAFLKKRSVQYTLGGVVLLLVIIRVFGGSGKTDGQSTEKVSAQDLVQEVFVTGKLKASQQAELTFEQTGTLVFRPLAVGTKVEAGQVLMQLDTEALNAQLRQAEAGVEAAAARLSQLRAAVESQDAKLAELQRGTRAEELTIAKTTVASAKQTVKDATNNLKKATTETETTLKNLYDDVPDILHNAFGTTDALLKVTLEPLIVGSLENGYSITFTACDVQAASVVVRLRTEMEPERLAFLKSLSALNETTTTEPYDLAVKHSLVSLESSKAFTERLYDLFTLPCSMSNASFDDERTLVQSARTSINTEVNTLREKEQALAAQKNANETSLASSETRLNDAKNVLKKAKDELALQEAGAAAEEITFQETQVKQARANVLAQSAELKKARAQLDSAVASLRKASLRAPFAGIITQYSGELGETLGPSTPAMALMSFAKFEVLANVPEIDIGRIALGNPVRITLDAYPGEVFPAHVSAVDPAETIVDGVVNFRITAAFDSESDKMKSGLTSNLAIETAQKIGVLVLPQHTLIERDDGVFVNVVKSNGAAEERMIEIGIRGQDGLVEIISGVSEGEIILAVGLKQTE